MSENVEVVEVQESKPALKKAQKVSNPLLDIASEVENISKGKALSRAEKLVDDIDRSFIEMGGLLKKIRENTWYEGFESYGAYVEAKFGFAERKARYLEEIYVNLVDKQIPWEKVAGLGWTKLKDLAKVLTVENVDEWVAKATPLTVKELEALLKAEAAKASGESTETTSTTQTIKFKLQNDQIATVQNALAKAKGEVGTEFDNVALETICAGYLGDLYKVSGPVEKTPAESIKAVVDQIGWLEALKAFGEFLPSDIEVDVKKAGQ